MHYRHSKQNLNILDLASSLHGGGPTLSGGGLSLMDRCSAAYQQRQHPPALPIGGAFDCGLTSPTAPPPPFFDPTGARSAPGVLEPSIFADEQRKFDQIRQAAGLPPVGFRHGALSADVFKEQAAAAVAAHKFAFQQKANGQSLTLPTVNIENGGISMDILKALALSAVPNLSDHFLLSQFYSQRSFDPMFLFNNSMTDQNILHSHVPSVSTKAIPHNNPVDQGAWQRKRPTDWLIDDVISWTVAFAEKRGVCADQLRADRLAGCTGLRLALMTRRQFEDMDPRFGGALYDEFRQLLGDNVDWDELLPQSRAVAAMAAAAASSRTSTPAAYHGGGGAAGAGRRRQPSAPQPHAMQPSTSAQASAASPLPPRFKTSPTAATSLNHRDSVIKTAGYGQPGVSFLVPTSMHDLMDHKSVMKEECTPLLKVDAVYRDGVLSATGSDHRHKCAIPMHKISKKQRLPGEVVLTASGKPRKRSQHTKGNKLWEFIRDALKNPDTNPSIVRWEDHMTGVFRIVDSEKLARLWGQKKNNQRMTYEKLSRAMRTYYEKQILEPVPKTGLYPKKLVYKFGPSAHDWRCTNEAAVFSVFERPTATEVGRASMAGDAMDVDVGCFREFFQSARLLQAAAANQATSDVASGGPCPQLVPDARGVDSLSTTHNVEQATSEQRGVSASSADDAQRATANMGALLAAASVMGTAHALALNANVAAATALFMSSLNASDSDGGGGRPTDDQQLAINTDNTTAATAADQAASASATPSPKHSDVA